MSRADANPFSQATYLASAHDLHELPPDEGAEIAFVGRSNAGKSSAINALTGRHRLAFVSRTPGRTQLINFFSLGERIALVDLPGYGYAKVPPSVKAHWEQVLAAYVGARRALRGLVLIMDARHPLKPVDETLLAWYAPTGKPVHCLLTKADKLTRQEQTAALRKVQAALAQQKFNATSQLFSALRKTGLDEARMRISAILGGQMGDDMGEASETKKKGAPEKG